MPRALTRLAAQIETYPARAFATFAALHLAIWTALPTLLYANLPLDIIEGLLYGREWVIGSDKLPPLPWWLLEICYVVFGHDVAYYLLAEIAVIATFVLIYATALPLVGPLRALLAVLIVDGLHYLNLSSVKFNHDVIQLPFWALAGFAFCAALRSGRTLDWIILGCALGGAFWSKYFVVVLAVPLAAFLLFDREARTRLVTPGPWIALAVALVIALPHLVWLVTHDFLPFRYVNARATVSHGPLDHVFHPLQTLAFQVAALAPALVIASPLLWRQPIAAWPQAHSLVPRAITVLAFGPIAAFVLLSFVTGRGTIASWGFPVWIFFGAWVVLQAAPTIDATRPMRVVILWAVVFAVYVVAFAADYTVLPMIDHRYRAAFFPGDQLAATLTQRFRAATGAPLRYVIGSMWDGGNVAHYSPDRPQVLIDGLPRRAPWIDLDDLHRKGALLVWTGNDTAHLPAAFADVAPDAEVETPFTLAMRRGSGKVHVGWAILKPRRPSP